MLVGLPWNLPVRPVDAARSSKTAPVADKAQLSPVDHAVRHPKAVVARIEKEQRRDLLTQISQAAPHLSQNPEQLCAPLEQLERQVNFTGKSQNGFAMGAGFSSGRTYEATPPRKRATMAEAVADYGKYLDKIVHAEGRENSKPDEADQQSAITCVGLEYNYLHRNHERVELFERLVGLLQSPYNALGVLQDVETVPTERRQEVLEEIESRVRALRAKGRAPQTNTETLGEGPQLSTLATRLSMAGRMQRPEDKLGDLLEQMPEARKHLPAELRAHAMSATEVAARYREPRETLADGVERFVPAFNAMKALTGINDAVTVMVLMAGLPDSDPQQLSDLRQCGEHLRTLKPIPSNVLAPAMQDAFAATGRPLNRLKKTLRSYELTGDLYGLSKAKAMIEDKLDSGAIIGTRDEWMTRLEHRLEQLTLFEPDPAKAYARAQQELFGSGGDRVGGEHGGYFVIGSSRLPVRLSK